MILGYNTNGFAHHRLEDAIELIAGMGYRGIALTPDVHHANPDTLCERELLRWQRDRDLTFVIETGSRFLLDRTRKHRPTLLDPDPAARDVRFGFLRWCVEVAAKLSAPCVSFWSGTPDTGESSDILLDRLALECRRLAEFAADAGVRLAFEPEPGMLVDTMPKFRHLFDRVNHPAFGLTLDVGHLICMHETPIAPIIREWRDVLWNVHLDDMKPDVHDHLMFGDGEVPFEDLFAALDEIGFSGMASVELSRHSHDAVNVAKASIAMLDRYEKTPREPRRFQSGS
jgi:sugar phosphate isomerase/epimerase